jgi:hypothetical protein
MRAAGPAVFFAVLLVLAGCATSVTNQVAGPPFVGLSRPPVVAEQPPVLAVAAIVVDKKGAVVTNLRARDFEVSVDGRRQPVATIARLYRGPGAASLASSAAPALRGEMRPLAEPSRTILIVLDQPSFGPGDGTRARAIVDSCLAVLGVADRVAVVSLPLGHDTTISFERAAIRQTLSSLRPMRGAGAEALSLDAPDSARDRDDAQPPAGEAAAGPARMDTVQEGQGSPPGTDATDESAPPRAKRGSAGDIASAAALKAHAVSSLGGLSAMLRSLATTPGGKTVLFVSAGLVAADARAEAGEAGEKDLRALALETGGILVPLSSRPGQALERLAGQLSFSYLLLLPSIAGGAGPAPHTIGVTVPRRPGLAVHVLRKATSGPVTAETIAASLSPRPIADARPEPGGPVLAAAPDTRNRDLDQVLARVSDYVREVRQELFSIVSEETYTQEATSDSSQKAALGGAPAGPNAETRTLVSDYLQVKVPGREGGLPFRDVFEVDGQSVRDRQDRLVKLFVASSQSNAIENARDIVRESARYNIGSVPRDLNLPTLPLWFLEPENTRRFKFRKVGEETLSGRRVWVIQYTETVHPTFIRSPEGDDIVASGQIWAEPKTGRIHRTLLTAWVASITVDYASRPEVPGLWLPVTMEERYTGDGVTIKGKATYAKFRQFQVQTSAQVVLPKK